MKPLLLALFDSVHLAPEIQAQCDAELGDLELRLFPDGETYVRINSEVKNRRIILVASLNQPNEKLVSLLWVAETARVLGAKEVGLIAPYLAYMRQDKQFNPGEGITSKYFARLLSQYFNWLITVDPHLHRYSSLGEIYSIPSVVLHASAAIADWIKNHIKNPLIIGPDQESKQWVAEISQKAAAPYIVLEKIRKDDRHVEVVLPAIEQYKDCMPVLVDDIISTARTMIETIQHLKNAHMKLPICIGIHAVFSGNAYDALLKAGAQKILTCNTIAHVSNAIDLAPVMGKAVLGYLLGE